MGPYCIYCDHRCFVIRNVPGEGRRMMATCPGGMKFDLEHTGHTYLTAINPCAVTS